jgi:hypothetical protein
LVKSITGERQRIPIGISDPRLLGISSDGKLVLLTGSGDESPESFGSLWMVNLQLGSRSLIAKWEDWQGATLVEAMDKPIAVQNKP